jgi:NTE family protein
MFLGAVPGWGHATDAADAPEARPRTCLVLSGGGARGVAHVGVLKVLEELRIPIDCVVGTSMGAILGGAWASGMPAAEIERIVREVDWTLVLSDDPPRPDRSARAKELERLRMTRAEFGVRNGEAVFPLGVRSGQQLEPVLRALAGTRAPVATFDELPIAFRAIATDIETGQMVVLDRGNMSAAMRASMSVPGMFAPQQIDGRLLADGGLVRNLGIDVAREQLGAERVIAVNLGTPLLKRERLVSLFGVTEQMLNILTEQNVQVSRAQLVAGDRLIEPELGDFRSSDFVHSPETIAVGERAGRAAAAALAPFQVPQAEYDAWRAGHHAATPLTQFARAQVDTTGLTRVDPQSVKAIFESALAGDTSDASLRRGVRALYRTDDFELVGVRVEQGADTAVIVHPREKSWGPNYARFGLTLSTDGEGESAFNVLGDVRATWLNRRALEWRTTGTLGDLSALTSELLQPIDLQRKWFVAGGIDLGQRIDDFIVDDVAIARFRNRGARAKVDVGRYIGRLGEVRAGYEYGRVSSTLVSGDAGVPNSEDDIGAVRFQFTADRLDNWDFPSSGYYAAADVRVAQDGLGSDLGYERYQLDLQKAFGFGRHGLTLAARFGETVGDSVPVFDAFSLGGFQNLSGASERQLLGRDVLFGRLVYRYQLRGIEALADRLFLGGSLEAGRIQDRLNGTIGTDEDLRFATSAFLAASTVLGPVYLGGGVSEGGDRAFYLFVGRP